MSDPLNTPSGAEGEQTDGTMTQESSGADQGQPDGTTGTGDDERGFPGAGEGGAAQTAGGATDATVEDTGD